MRVLIFILFFSTCVYGNSDIWKHVVTIDRIIWEERPEKYNDKEVEDKHLVRRLYLDITGKIPTYSQMNDFNEQEGVDKKQVLIRKLLSSKGYASHYTNFWADLLRVPYNERSYFAYHDDFKKYIYSNVYSNTPVNDLVYKFITSKGHLLENPAVGFYLIDRATNTMDTINATTRAFLGTRIGCAQCHNHRFDKWTQKEFYELSSYMWGISARRMQNNVYEQILRTHISDLRKSGIKLNSNINFVLMPSSGGVVFKEKNKLKYPTDYVYDNAEAGSLVESRIVFDYGKTDIQGKDRVDTFAKWLTTDNEMFAKVMANRIWKRMFTVAIVEPVDDFKDAVEIENKQLFDALGSIFHEVNYDLKKFIEIIVNTEAYLMQVNKFYDIDEKNYDMQSIPMRRMSAQQLYDSLLTLRFGDLDSYDDHSFSKDDMQKELSELAMKYIKDLDPILKEYNKTNGRDSSIIDERIKTYMLNTIDRIKYIEEQYFVQNNLDEPTYEGSNKQSKRKVTRSTFQSSSDFMTIFGNTDRTSPESMGDNSSTMQQVLKMMNSQECYNVIKKDSFLMIELDKREEFINKIKFLYRSIYSRNPTLKEIKIAEHYLEGKKKEYWGKYIIALMNSPEFFFIK